jgi:hypothetical protein
MVVPCMDENVVGQRLVEAASEQHQCTFFLLFAVLCDSRASPVARNLDTALDTSSAAS